MEKLNELEAKVEELEKKVGAQHEVYNYIDDNMPGWVRDDVTWMADRGIIKGNGNGLNLSPIKLWTIAVIVRTAKYLGKLMGVKM